MTASGKFKLRTLGHACLVLNREGENPSLITDPWLVGLVYWRNWWLPQR
jgi:L-ascorbate metabolism protein UlaG (beta-lactamase superfamily)